MKRFALCIISCLVCIAAFARPSNVSFAHMALNEGLSDTQITSIMQDSKGFMWFSTRYGLNRYDGYSVRTFMHDPSNPNSLPDNSVGAVWEDASGSLWIQSGWQQYVCYDPRSEKFTPAVDVLAARYGVKADPTHIVVDKDKCLWLATSQSIYCYDAEGKQACVAPVRLDASVSCISPAEGGLIVLYADGSFDMIDKGDDGVRTNRDLSRLIPITAKPNNVYCDIVGDLWFYGNGQGVMLLEHGNGDWVRIDDTEASRHKLSSLSVTDIIEDAKGNIWIATDHGGVDVVDRDSGTVTYLTHMPLDAGSLLQNSVICLYCDSDGGIWASGEFSNIVNNPIWQTVNFSPVRTRQIRIDGDRINSGSVSNYDDIEVLVCE